jgi:Trypsin
MRQRAVLLLCAWVAVLVPAGVASSRPEVVGGRQIDAAQAPWTVWVGSAAKGCTGALLDATHVLTAAHCEFGADSRTVDPTTMWIWAGTSNFQAPAPGDAAQRVAVASFRIHPYFVYDPSAVHPDDVAVLTLASPVTLGQLVQPVALPAPNASLQPGQVAQLAGFGLEDPAAIAASGWLNEIDLTLGDPAHCGSANAVWICATSPTGAACLGDSGGGLVLPGAAPTLVGVTVSVELGCPAGGSTGFTNLLAPEIGDFVRGSDAPPTAPRLSRGALLSASVFLDAGTTLGCDPGVWSGSPAYGYSFLDATTHAVLQQGSRATYVPSLADVGRSIQCVATATNAGGTGTSESEVSPEVDVAPGVHARAVTVRRGHTARLAVAIAGSVDAGRTRVCAVVPASVAAAACIAVPATARGVYRLTAHLSLAVKATARPGRVAVRIAVSLPEGRVVTGRATLVVRR